MVKVGATSDTIAENVAVSVSPKVSVTVKVNVWVVPSKFSVIKTPGYNYLHLPSDPDN